MAKAIGKYRVGSINPDKIIGRISLDRIKGSIGPKEPIVSFEHKLPPTRRFESLEKLGDDVYYKIIADAFYPENPKILSRAQKFWFRGKDEPTSEDLRRMTTAATRFKFNRLKYPIRSRFPYKGKRIDKAALEYMTQVDPVDKARYAAYEDNWKKIEKVSKERLKNLWWNNLTREERREINANPEYKSKLVGRLTRTIDEIDKGPMTRMDKMTNDNAGAFFSYRPDGKSVIRTARNSNRDSVHEMAGHSVDYALRETPTGYINKYSTAQDELTQLYDWYNIRPEIRERWIRNGRVEGPNNPRPKTLSMDEKSESQIYNENLEEHIARMTEFALKKSNDGLNLFNRSFRYWPEEVKTDFAEWMKVRSGFPEDVPTQELIDFYSSFPELFGKGGYIRLAGQIFGGN